ncbi:MAG: hypothetical protein IPO19_14110 [Rhodoferax sp.]|nr:hypothetical protein [Rhodoferax sp.]
MARRSGTTTPRPCYGSNSLNTASAQSACNWVATPPWDTLGGIDIGLDCFPHNSGTTLFETLYMGVPFVTLAGRPSVGRIGSAILRGSGHPEWIAHSEADYVERTCQLAADLSALNALRVRLRGAMQASRIMDEPGFARSVEVLTGPLFETWATITGSDITVPPRLAGNSPSHFRNEESS